MKKITSVIGNFTGFLDDLFRGLNEKKMDVSNLMLHHIGYMTMNPSHYTKKSMELSEFAKFKGELRQKGRVVTLYELIEPLVYKGRVVKNVELVCPLNTTFETGKLNHGCFKTKKRLSYP